MQDTMNSESNKSQFSAEFFAQRTESRQQGRTKIPSLQEVRNDDPSIYEGVDFRENYHPEDLSNSSESAAQMRRQSQSTQNVSMNWESPEVSREWVSPELRLQPSEPPSEPSEPQPPSGPITGNTSKYFKTVLEEISKSSALYSLKTKVERLLKGSLHPKQIKDLTKWTKSDRYIPLHMMMLLNSIQEDHQKVSEFVVKSLTLQQQNRLRKEAKKPSAEVKLQHLQRLYDDVKEYVQVHTRTFSMIVLEEDERESHRLLKKAVEEYQEMTHADLSHSSKVQPQKYRRLIRGYGKNNYI